MKTGRPHTLAMLAGAAASALSVAEGLAVVAWTKGRKEWLRYIPYAGSYTGKSRSYPSARGDRKRAARRTMIANWRGEARPYGYRHSSARRAYDLETGAAQ